MKRGNAEGGSRQRARDNVSFEKNVALLVQMKNDRCKITMARCHPIAIYVNKYTYNECAHSRYTTHIDCIRKTFHLVNGYALLSVTFQ